MNNQTELQAILQTMEVPSLRLSDYHWLQRNLAIRNRNHPEFKRAMEIIKETLKDYRGMQI